MIYTSFFGFQEEPFRLTPDPRFFHVAEPHRVALETLLQGIMTRKGFILLTGPVGTGKTTVLHAALQILSNRSVTKAQVLCGFIVNPVLTRDEFFETMLDEFGVVCDSPSKPRRLVALREKFLEAQRLGTTAVLLVDEAHLLSTELLEEIRLLSNADSYNEKLVQIILCGQPELHRLLLRPESRALRQRIACIGQLRVLNLGETRAYITERLQHAGANGASPFSAAAVEAIHKYSGGVPRVINLICDTCLVHACRSQAKHVDADQVSMAALELGLSLKGDNDGAYDNIFEKLTHSMKKRAAIASPYRNESVRSAEQ